MKPQNQIFENKKVLIMGLGTKGGGVESAVFAFKQGAEITITDLHDAEYLKSSLKQLKSIPKTLVLGQHRFEDFENHDIIIKNEGIKNDNPYIQHALKHNKQVETPINLFSKLYNKPFIGITGTKGKSYTTALVTHLLSAFNKNVAAAGNNCISPLKYLEQDVDYVLELSSWQLHELGIQKLSPHIACWLNFFPDHLNYYASLDGYFEDKKQIIEYQDENDYSILPVGYTKLRNIQTKANKILFSTENHGNYHLNNNESICYSDNNSIFYKDKASCQKLFKLNQIRHQFAPHQLELMLACICITICYAKNNNFPLAQTIKNIIDRLNIFKGLEHRFETIYKKADYEIINDSAASTPESAVLALKALKSRPIVLITGGGGDKSLNYSFLAKVIQNYDAQVILFENDIPSEILMKELKALGYQKYHVVNNLQSAVNEAFKLSNSSGTILLSPACSGYPMFKDMFERGKLFKKYAFDMLHD